MQTIATNIRFDKDEYRELKNISQSGGKSVASFIRDAIRSYKEEVLRSKQSRMALYNQIVRSSVKIDIPVVKLVHEGRKFE